MPTKKLQKSSLKTIIDTSSYRLSKKKIKTSKSTISFEEKSIENQEIEEDEIENEELGIEESVSQTNEAMSRISLLILDYLQFKAARTIQRFARCWLYRRLYLRKRRSAIIIQAQWRRFFYQRRYYLKVEELLQQRIEEHFHTSARKIQALWRGWWSRQHIHDHTHLMHMQRVAGEDLLQCVAFKLHHLLRTHQIPGVYSIRNSTTLSKVEQLLASLSFKTCNIHTRKAKEHRRRAVEEARKIHKNSICGTEIPFTGPNINNLCKPECMPLYTEKEADRKMTRILKLYEEARRESEQSKVLRKKSNSASKEVGGVESKPVLSSFCGDVVDSMKKWKIIAENNLNVDIEIIKKPENVKNFLTEVESKLSLFQENCHCKGDVVRQLNRQKMKDAPGEKKYSTVRNGNSYKALLKF